MKVIVTAGPTREYIDTVRFITNGSSGRMGYACAASALAAGHEVTLITGPTALTPPAGCDVVRIETVGELQAALEQRFDGCEALIMTAAVGDFTVEDRSATKIPRGGGAITLRLSPTPDVLAGLAKRKRKEQVIIGFAVEDKHDQAKAAREMLAKKCSFMVLNTPAAMGQDSSEACILSPQGLALAWAARPKAELADAVVALLKRA